MANQRSVLCLVLLGVFLSAMADQPWVELFNEKSLNGWKEKV